MMHKISVAMCTYNGEQFLKEQIDSILNQSFLVDEIVVCDDGSKDSTLLLLEEYSKKNTNIFKIHKNQVNLRSVKNFEKAISLCSGDIIFLSDQDDIWTTDKVEKMISYFDKHPNIDVLATNGFCIDDSSTIQEKYSVWDVPEFLTEKKVEFEYLIINGFISNIATGASMAFRNSTISEIIPFPTINGFHHDAWIALLASKKNTFDLLSEKLFFYRTHKNQQVGSVFFEKTVNSKKLLLEIFNYTDFDVSFLNLKKRLKRISLSIKKLKTFNFYNQNQKLFFKDDIENATQLFYKTQTNFKKNFPIKFFFLNIVDTIKNKRTI